MTHPVPGHGKKLNRFPLGSFHGQSFLTYYQRHANYKAKTKLMRSFKLLVLAAAAAILLAGATVSFADGRGDRSGGYYRGGYHSGHYRGGDHYGDYRGRHGYSSFDFDVVVGDPFWRGPWYYPYYSPYYDPYYYYPFYYPYAPVVTVPSTPQEYIERPHGKSSPAPSGVWYYCPESKAYYPYVRECPGGWQKVPAKPPSESGR